MSDVIDVVLSLQPIPGLQAVWWVFKAFYTQYEKSKWCKAQLRAMAQSIAELLLTLNKAKKDRLDSRTEEELVNLEALLMEITTWISKQKGKNFLKSLYQAGDREATLEQYQKKLLLTIERFNLAALLSVTHFQQTFEAARVQDQNDLNDLLLDIQRDQKKLAQALEDQQSNILAMMISIQRALQSAELRNPAEKQFLKSSFNYLAYTSGIKAPNVEPWTISSFDVEFEDQIGKGGFGKVYQGVWNHCPVALKVLQEDGIVPREAAIKREVRIWEKLRHPNLLQFLGANVLDDPPFIVMPYMQHGNAMDYLQSHPDINRTRILLQATRGLIYLHRQGIIHGDIKATNILMDDGLNAVLADFGLSRLKAEVTSKVSSTVQFGNSPVVLSGGLYWMAPERIEGGPLQFASDVYSFGMTIYEVITCEIPLSSYPLNALLDAVVNKGLRPQRPLQPEDALAADMSDALWTLCVKCWVKDPQSRPVATAVLKDLSNCPPSTTSKRGDASNVTSAFSRMEVKGQPQTPTGFEDAFTTLPNSIPSSVEVKTPPQTPSSFEGSFEDAFTQFSDPTPARLEVKTQPQTLPSFDDVFTTPFSDPKPARLDVKAQSQTLPSLDGASFDDAFPTQFSDPIPTRLDVKPQPQTLPSFDDAFTTFSDLTPERLDVKAHSQGPPSLDDASFDDVFTQFSNSNPARLDVKAQLQSPFSFEDSFEGAFIPRFSDPIPARLDVSVQPQTLPSLDDVSFDDAFTAFSDPSPAGLSPGIFFATAEEIDLVDAVFKEGDPNNSGLLQGEKAVVIFARSNIPPSTMGDVWAFADEKNNGYLTRDETAMALRLMSYSREGLVPSKALSMRPSSPESLRQLKALIFNGLLRLPPFTMKERTKFLKVFEAYSPSNGLLAEHVVREAFARSGLSANEQSQVWTLTHIKGRNALDATEFCLGMHLIYHRLNNNITRLSDTLPPQLYEQIQKTMALPQPADSPVSPKIIDSPTPHLTLLLARSAFVKTTYKSQDDPKSQWPISPEEKAQFDNYFTTLDSQNRGRLDGDAAVPFFTKSQLSEKQLAQVWDLADIDGKGYLTKDEFAVAMHLIKKRKKGERLPSILPAALVPPSQRRVSVSKAVDFDVYFDKLDSSRCGYIEGDVARDFMSESKLPDTDLAAIWDLADTRGAGRLSRAEFAQAMWLIYDRLDGKPISSLFLST